MIRILKPNEIEVAVDVLRRGDLVAFPTETVYGLGGNAYSDDAVGKIFQYKQRPAFNPINVCYANLERAKDDVFLTDLALKLSEKFLPGAVTLILKRRSTSKVSWLCSAGGDTLGIRIPNQNTALNLLKSLDFPLAAPSANKSSELSPTSAKAVADSLGFNENLSILDGGECWVGIESTIVDLTQDVPTITRQGAVNQESLELVAGTRFCVKKKQLHKTLSAT